MPTSFEFSSCGSERTLHANCNYWWPCKPDFSTGGFIFGECSVAFNFLDSRSIKALTRLRCTSACRECIQRVKVSSLCNSAQLAPVQGTHAFTWSGTYRFTPLRAFSVLFSDFSRGSRHLHQKKGHESPMLIDLASDWQTTHRGYYANSLAPFCARVRKHRCANSIRHKQ